MFTGATAKFKLCDSDDLTLNLTDLKEILVYNYCLNKKNNNLTIKLHRNFSLCKIEKYLTPILLFFKVKI